MKTVRSFDLKRNRCKHDDCRDNCTSFKWEFQLRHKEYMVEQRLSVRKDCLLSEREFLSDKQSRIACAGHRYLRKRDS